MYTLIQDLRYAIRQLGRSPGFAAVAVLTVALGIGGTTAVLSIANGLFNQTLPVPGAERVVSAVQHRADGTPAPTVSYPEYLAYRDGAERVFSDLAAVGNMTFGLRTGTGAEPIAGTFVSGNYFGMLGVSAAAGRLIGPEDDTPGRASVVVVSHEVWRRRFDGDPGVVGRTIYVNGHPLTVVGIASPGFRGTQMMTAPEIWVPIASRELLAPGWVDVEGRRIVWLGMQGRLGDGVVRSQAEAALSAVGRNVTAEMGEGQRVERVTLARAGGVPTFLRDTVVSVTGFLLVASALVLLIAATNVAGMLLARAAARRREVAIRVAIGAGRGRLVRQALTESGLLFLMGAAAGTLLAFWLTRLAGLYLFTGDGPLPLVNLNPHPDAGVLAVTTILALLAGLIFGLAPATEAVRNDPGPAFNDASAGAGHGRSRLRNAMVVGQVMLSLLLLVGAGLFIRSLQEAARVDLGLDARDILIGRLSLQAHGYDRQGGLELYRELTERIEGMPGVVRASVADAHPLAGMEVSTAVEVGGGEPVELWYNPVSAGYFETLGIPLVQGRLIGSADRADTRNVTVVNESFVRRFFPEGDAVGATVIMGGDEIEIVGVVRDSRWSGLDDEGRVFAYRPIEQEYIANVSLMIRGSGGVNGLEPAIRREMRALDPDLPLQSVATFESTVRQLSLPQRVAAWTASGFGLLGLLLALVGLYGVLAFAVGRRTREIGVRVALGASGPAVMGLVLRQGITLVGTGILLGIAAGAALQPAIRGLLFGVSPADPVVIITVAGLLTVVALLASYLPARRAARVDPMIALRAE